MRDEQNDLRKYLQSEEDYFVRSLFNNSTQSYLEALENINKQDDWEEAYRIVEQDIFKPNEINIYSKAAVSFTDRLQTHFLKMKS